MAVSTRRRTAGNIALLAATACALLTPVQASAVEPRAADASTAVAGEMVQRASTRSHDLTGDGIPDLLARQPDLSNGSLWVYTNSGKLQGTSTFTAKTLVRAQDNWWGYPHSGTFDGLNTFKARTQVRKGRPLWNLMPTWTRENPDMVSASEATGEMYGCAHTNKFDGVRRVPVRQHLPERGICRRKNAVQLRCPADHCDAQPCGQRAYR
uniref:hypothetical protein n=1 Tax=Kibdelosporangium aridum TaxID=2030 RepID=UPI001F28BB33|nr:hypothetical protein [Kibdelosporangium aridum]